MSEPKSAPTTLPAFETTESRTKIVTDSLGFRLELSVAAEDIAGRGQHKTYEQGGSVAKDASHKITINCNLRDAELAEVIAHEAYHLFYSVRPLIGVDEETEAEVFGQLVRRIHRLILSCEAAPASVGADAAATLEELHD